MIVLNDNGRSYAPTVSQLSQSLTSLRLNPTYTQTRERLRNRLRGLPGFGPLAYTGVHSVASALREMVSPHTFFEALGVRYAGPIDGHDIDLMEQAFAHAAEWDGPIVVHVLTQKGRGYGPAEQDDIQRLHDVKATTKVITLENTIGSSAGSAVGSSAGADVGGVATPGSTPDAEVHQPPGRATTYTDAFSRALLAAAENDARVVALTAAMPGPTGLLPFQARFPTRFFDVGIAEQHEVTAAAGMAMAGIRPVVAVYSTFFSRAFDQANLDVGLHESPVVFVLDRAGITGDDGPSHHGILDMALALSIPGMTVFAPSAAEEVAPMLRTALALSGPSTIRFPKTAPRHVDESEVGSGLDGAQGAQRRRLGLPARGGQAPGGVHRRGRSAGDRGHRRHGVGRPGRRTARRRHARRRRPSRPGGHRRRRRAPRRCRRLHHRRHGVRPRSAGPAPARRPGSWVCPASTWPRARRTTFWTASASTGSASPRACGGPVSPCRPASARPEPAPAAFPTPGRPSPSQARLAPLARTKSLTA